MVTAKSLVSKDFALYDNDDQMKIMCCHMVRSLAASMAMIISQVPILFLTFAP